VPTKAGKRRQCFTSLRPVPTEAFRKGDFSAATVPVRDPERGLAAFPGNIIPSSRIDLIARKILDRGSFPSPTAGLSPPNNFSAVNPLPGGVNQSSAGPDPRYRGA